MRITVLVVSLLGFAGVSKATSVPPASPTTTTEPKIGTPLSAEVDEETRFEEPVADKGTVVRTLGRETAHKPTDHDLLMKDKEQSESRAASELTSGAKATDELEQTPREKATQQSSQPAAAVEAEPQEKPQTSDVVPNRYSSAVELPVIAEDASPPAQFTETKKSVVAEQEVRSTSFKVRGASRQFGARPEVEPFTAELLLNDKQQHKTYKNYKVYRVLVESRKQEQYLAALENDYARNVSLWEDAIIDRNVTLAVPPQSVKSLEEDFDSKAIRYSILTENLKTWLDEEMKSVDPNLFLQHKDVGNFKLNTYHSLDEISSYIDLLASQYPNIVKPIELGRTYEGNAIKGLVLSTGGGPKRAVYIDSGTHAREWISVASNLYILSTLITNADSDPELRSILDRYEFHFVPVINADGYKYTWNGDRLWRKNRVRFQGFYWCSGVDCNRNFDYSWGGEGASANPCSDVYRGTQAFSELETRAVRDYITGIKDRLALYLSLHAYGQYLLLPYGAGPSQISRENRAQMAAAGVFRDAISKATGQTYKVGPSSQMLYAASGVSNDWVHSQGVTHAYVAELRDTGTRGFLLPQDQILPAAEEVFEGIKALVQHIAATDLKT